MPCGDGNRYYTYSIGTEPSVSTYIDSSFRADSADAGLRQLKTKLLFLGLDEEQTSSIVRFCERRGYKSWKCSKAGAPKWGRNTSNALSNPSGTSTSVVIGTCLVLGGILNPRHLALVRVSYSRTTFLLSDVATASHDTRIYCVRLQSQSGIPRMSSFDTERRDIGKTANNLDGWMVRNGPVRQKELPLNRNSATFWINSKHL